MRDRTLNLISIAASEALSTLRFVQSTAEWLDKAAEAAVEHAEQLRSMARQMWDMATDIRRIAATAAEVHAEIRDAAVASNGHPEADAGPKPRADRIRDVIRDSAHPMTPEDVLVALHKAGDLTATPQIVTNALIALMNRGAVRRPERGRYVAQ